MMQACRLIQDPDIGLKLDGEFFNIYTGEIIDYESLKIPFSKKKLYVSNWYGNEKWLNTIEDTKKIKYEILSRDLFSYNETLFLRIPGYKNYAISKNGTVISLKRRNILKRRCSDNGYFVVHITNSDGISKMVKVHILVALTFIGNRKPGYVIDHLDGNKFNPEASNLEYVTPGTNTRRSLTMGLQKNKMWDESEIRIICSMIESGRDNSFIENYFKYKGISHRSMIMTLHLIRSGKYYRDISMDYKFPSNSYLNKKSRVLTESDVRNIRSDKRKISEIAKEYKVSASTISKVKKGLTFKYVD